MTPVKRGFPIVGAMFLAVAAIKLLRGDNWVVWFLLSLPFGALSLFRWRRGEGR